MPRSRLVADLDLRLERVPICNPCLVEAEARELLARRLLARRMLGRRARRVRPATTSLARQLASLKAEEPAAVT
jgi:hypothetical protein